MAKSQNDLLESIMEQNKLLMQRLTELENAQKNIAPPERIIDPHSRAARKGYKFIKTRVLSEEGDLIWGILEVPETDARKAFDPNTQTVHNRESVMKGNPMAEKPLGQNDIEVTGI